MSFFSKLASVVANVFGANKAPADLRTAVKALHPDAIVENNIFTNGPLNVTMVALPGVSPGTLPADLKDLIKNGDGTVTLVFTGSAADDIAKVVKSPVDAAAAVADKLLTNNDIATKMDDVMTQITNVYNMVMPGENLTPAQLAKKVLGLAATALGKNDTFKSASDMYKAFLIKVLVDGQLKFTIPSSVSDKLSKLGMDKVASNPAAAAAMALAASQINTILEQALKGLHGDLAVY